MDRAGSRPATEAEPVTLGALFGRFLGLGARAWGGPAAQIAMMRDELVGRPGWPQRDHFNRILAVYQALPGPEATEMAAHMGFLRRGRVGAVVAGLGFVLPGFVLMLALSAAYVALGPGSATLQGLLAGFGPAVAALVAVACIRLGTHAVHDETLLGLFVAAALATLAGVPFYVVLPVAAAAGLARHRLAAVAAALALVVLAVGWLAWDTQDGAGVRPEGDVDGASLLDLAWSGLKAGSLTFGGAYTVLPFLHEDAVGSYVDEGTFLDGIALAGTLPAPLIIVATFLGYVGGAMPGAFVMTATIFAPAFAFTLLLGHRIEAIANHERLAGALDAVAAAVVGILAALAWALLLPVLATGLGIVLALAAFLALIGWTSRAATPVVLLACGAIGAAAHLAL